MSRLSSLLRFALLYIVLFAGVVLANHRTDFRSQREQSGRPHQRARPYLSDARHKFRNQRVVNGSECVASNPAAIKAPKKNVWAQLTSNETSAVEHWLHQQKDLDLTHSTDRNVLSNIELLLPNKTNVLSYFDEGGREPARYAKAILNVNSRDASTFEYILVGPLPINSATKWERLTYPYTRKSGSIRNLNFKHREWGKHITNAAQAVANITKHLWPGAKPAVIRESAPMLQSSDGEMIGSWYAYGNEKFGLYDTETLLPLNFYFGVEWEYANPSNWTFLGYLYNDTLYPDAASFQEAHQQGKIQQSVANIAGQWTNTGQRGEVLPLDGLPPPQAVAPSGSRFSWDKKARYIQWMDFSFYMAWTINRGWALYDIRHKGRRIIYELSFQEALAHYAGTDPAQSTTSYLDASYLMGRDIDELVPGYDCPSYATYMDTPDSTYSGEPSTTKNSVCFFEFDSDYPMARHTYYSYMANTKNIKFVIRAVYTVGNYDYMFSYEFFLDGSIQVQVRASGYIQAQYYQGNEEYGYRIHEALSGSMHDHTLNFKLDLDILGTANTAQLTTFVPANERYIWSPQPRQTMKLQRQFVESEDDSRLIWNRATQYRIINTDKPNRLGEYRGYRILPSDGTTHFTNNQSSNLANCIYPFTFDMAVTKQKDTEPQSTDQLDDNDIWNPMVNFDTFFDGESLMQEDLVVWFNLGMHHLPHTGDLPNTVFTTAHAGITIMPLNYYTHDISTETLSQVQINFKDGNLTKVQTFGQQEAVCSVDLAKEAQDLYSLTGGYY